MVGIIGLGMVWGWLLLLVGDPLTRPWRNALLLTLASTPLAGLVWWITNIGLMLLFLATAVVTFIIHLAWRSQLRQRTNSPSPQEG